MSENDDLTPLERRGFSNLDRELMPPAFVEDRIVAELKRKGAIRAKQRAGVLRVATVSALALIVFLAGCAAGGRFFRRWSETTLVPAGYMVVVRTSRATDPVDASEELQRVNEYSVWARSLGQQGQMLGGEKLKDEALVLTGNGASVSESRVAAAEGAIAGYFLLPITLNEAQARAVALTCPHLKHGGTVELRRIERF